MIHRPWRIRHGPEWESSLAAADPHDGCFAENLSVAEDALRTDPRAWSHPFLDARDDLRVFTTRDRAAGYRVIIFFSIDQSAMQIEFRWIELEQL